MKYLFAAIALLAIAFFVAGIHHFRVHREEMQEKEAERAAKKVTGENSDLSDA